MDVDWLAHVAEEEGNLRLADGATSEDGSAQFGRLEIYAKGGWGTVCSEGFGGFGANPFAIPSPAAAFPPEAADVACQQLGFKKGSAMQPVVRSCLSCTLAVTRSEHSYDIDLVSPL